VLAIGFAAQYYTEKEESDEEMWGDKAILQRRYPPDDDLEDYFEARQEARQIRKFFRFDRTPIGHSPLETFLPMRCIQTHGKIL
jgi:hypothetical protein